MTTVISNNLVLSNAFEPGDNGNAGVIGYQNLLNVSNVTATSALATNPITSVANPATAYTWESAVADASDVVSYPNDTNLMPSPFDPEGWSTDSDITIANANLPNPSGESFAGLAEQIGGGTAIFSQSAPVASVLAGEKLYLSALVKNVNYDMDFSCFFSSNENGGVRVVVNVNDGSIKSIGSGIEVNYQDLGDGWRLIQASILVPINWTNASGNFRLRDESLGIPPIGSQLYVQASFFGKADDWPAVVQEGGVRIAVQTAGQQIDYIGIARHNLDQIGLTVTVKYNGVTVVSSASVSSIQAILFLLNEATPTTVEIIIKGATVAPQIGVIYIGKALRLERNIYVGHSPINYSRDRVSVNGVSENGQYLGAIDVRQTNSTSVSLQNLTPDWYRNSLDPFFALSPRPPCFYAWRPEGYPMEVGYCWVEGKPSMSNQRSNGLVECSFNFRGIV